MSDARRLLVVTYYFGPNGPVGGLRWWGITKYLARLGWRASVVTAAHPFADGASRGAHVERCPPLWTFLDGCRLLRWLVFGRSPEGLANASRKTPGVDLPDPVRRLYRELVALLTFPDEGRGWMLRTALRTRSLIRRFRPRVVVSSGPPHSAHLVAALATLGTPVRWWIDLRDPWAGPLPKVWESHPKLGSRTFRAVTPPLERLAFGAAQGVITTTHPLAATLAARYAGLPVVCIPNGVDPESLPPPARDPYPGLGVAYAGTLYASRDVGPVVRALRIFFSRHPEAADAGSKLRIAGQAVGDHARTFREAIAAAGMRQYVELLGPLPRAQALNVVCRSRMAVVLAQEQELQVPAKLYESVAIGIPTLVVAEANSAAAVEGQRVGAVVRDPSDVEGISCVFEQVWRDGARERSPCPALISYERIAGLVDKLL